MPPPLIHLPKIGRLELLRDLFGEFYIPESVLLDAALMGGLDFPQMLDDLLATGFRLHPVQYQKAIDRWKAIKTTTP